MRFIFLIGISFSLIVACIGAFVAYKCWRLWRHANIAGIGVEVTKDRTFLSNNFKLVIVIGGLAGLHVVFELIEFYFSSSTPLIYNLFHFVYFLNLASIMTAFLMLAIAWYRLLSRVSKWDRRWIKGK